MQYRKMGTTGVEVSALGFGCMRLPEKDGKIDRSRAIGMIRKAIDQGLTYVDTAYPYHGGDSEVLVGEALQDGYRQKVSLATKLPVFKMETEEDFDRILTEQLTKLQTDHVDFYLLHALGRDRWENTVKPLKLLDKMLKAKEAGKVKYIGFSFHDDLDLFKEIIDAFPHWDFCQIQLNYVDTCHQAGIEGLEYASSKGLGVVIMEPLRGGYLANVPESVAEILGRTGKSPVEMALQFLWDRPEVSVVLSGMSTEDQAEQNMVYADKAAAHMLTEAEHENIREAEAKLRSFQEIPCTGCNYCSVCPQGIAIPQLFGAYNRCQVTMSMYEGKKLYREAKEAGALADACVGCQACEGQCPQNLPISQWMPKLAEMFGSC